jgi:hypothetical protein
MIAECMKANARTDDDQAKALVQALSVVGHGSRRYLPEHTFELARFAAARFAEAPSAVAEGCVLLAAAVLAHFQSPASRFTLCKALDAALRASGDPGRSGQAFDRIATALANSLAVVAPEGLLDYPTGCTPVDSVLRSQALRQGWMVFADRILDAEGIEIARRGSAEAPSSVAAPLETEDVIQALPHALRRHLESYLLMVGPGGPCEPTDSLRAVHSALLARWRRESQGGPAEALGRLYPDKPPTLGAWKKALNRIEQRLRGQPKAEAFLRGYGLYRREDG